MMRKLYKFFALLTVLTLCLAVLASCASSNKAKYRKAFDMIEAGNYEEAYALFLELGDYKEAAKEAAYFRYMPTSHYVECSSEEGDEIITYTVTLNDKNLPATVVEEYSTGFKHTCTFTHNEFGYITRRECSDTEGTILYEATYDAKGNRLNETITEKDGTVRKFDYTYNEKDQLVKVATTNIPNYYLSYTITYDAEGREAEVVYLDVDGTTSIEKTIYDEAGNILRVEWAEKGAESDLIYDYRYDEKGRLVEILITEDGEDGGFIKTTYDDKGQLLTEHAFYTFGYEYMDSYEYDEHGNVIKATYISPDIEDCDDVVRSTYTLVYLPFEYTEEEWTKICDSTQCRGAYH